MKTEQAGGSDSFRPLLFFLRGGESKDFKDFNDLNAAVRKNGKIKLA